MQNLASPHDYAVAIEPADIDFMGHVNNASYLKWVQAAVLDHWRRVVPAEVAASRLWVALKHEITYLRPAFLSDAVIASVVLEQARGARALYDTVIRRGDEVLARAKSCWCCVDAATLRPVRLTKDIVALFSDRGGSD
jgi:acyl-CoA thioester hydrolase